MKERKEASVMTLVISTVFILSSLTAIGINVNTTSVQNDSPYTGQLRIYIVEPESRWDNYDGDPYYYGFLDFAVDETLSIEYQDTYTNQVTWDAADAGYSNVKENNVMVIASVFNPEVNKGYAYPPFKNPFDAHYVDATAGAKPGEAGSNIVNEDFTHTVFVEEATAQYCQYCPAMAEALNSVYESEDYPFYFVALITKDRQGNVINSVALDHLINIYNLAAYPSAFFDGGKKVLVGGYEDVSYYQTRIEQSGSRDVHELDLSVSVEWLGDGNLQIDVSITNNEEIINTAPDTPSITGPTNGKIREEQTYTISTTDPEGNDVYYWVEFCADCQDAEWSGPFASGEEFTIEHTWTAEGTYTVRVKAKDSQGAESEWGTLEVSMPRVNRFSTRLSQRFLDLFPQLSSIIKTIFG